MKKTVILIISGLALLTASAQHTRAEHEYRDSATMAASQRYHKAGLIRKFFLGKNYRTVWATPVKAPVFRVSASGLKITELGGGQQTRSLRLEDARGEEWVLRSVEKEVSGAIPKILRNTLAQKVVQDMISGAHPYAPLVVYELAEAAGIVAPRPILYYVADDPALGEYRPLFAHTLCYLERREPTPDKSDTKSTATVVEKISEENDHLIMQRKVLKARLLDMLVADWDRHEDQWRWDEVDSAGNSFYYAIPRDRDQAFFNSNGALVQAARLIALPHLVGFRSSTKKIINLNKKTWGFDQTFLNELDAAEWERTIREFQSEVSDEVIRRAVSKLPPEVRPASAGLIEEKLKSRRDGLLKDGMRYYAFINRNVHIAGSGEEEVFRLTEEGGRLTVTVLNDKKKGQVIYKRSFDPKETRELHLLGLEGGDRFEVDPGLTSKIKVFFKGGEGADVYRIEGRLRRKEIVDSDHRQSDHPALAKSFQP